MVPESIVAQFFGRLAAPFTAETLFDQVPDVVYFLKDSEGRYICVNQTLAQRSGKSAKSELIGRTPAEVLGKQLGQSYEEQDRRVLQSGQQLLDELEVHVYPNRDRGWALTSKLPLAGADGRIIGLAGISRDLKAPDLRDEDFDHIAEAVEYAQARLAEPPPLKELAQVAAMSIYQLDRRMKRIFGLPTGQWLLKTRIDHACRQLLETELPIVEVALNCGYGDQSAFTRQFRRTTGQAPSAFRKLKT